jgi:hypothetical protein
MTSDSGVITRLGLVIAGNAMLWSSGEVEAEDEDVDTLREGDCTSKGVLGTCGEGVGVLIGEGVSSSMSGTSAGNGCMGAGETGVRGRSSN